MLHVIVPSYNNAEYLAQCLFSLAHQSLDPSQYTAVVIDDASRNPDHNAVMQHWCEQQGWTAITNEFNMCAPFTIRQGIEASGSGPDDVIFLLDGDDRIAHDALKTIADIYAEAPETLLTYGNYLPEPDRGQTLASDYPTLVRRRRDFRIHDISRYNHPITFRRRLWDSLDDADLQDADGQWFRAAYDTVLMMPMLEMAGPDRYVFCDKQMYHYNSLNPLSDAEINSNAVHQAAELVRSRPKKEMLP